MKKSLISTLLTPVLGSFAATMAVTLAVAPVVALAQPYYGNYSYDAYPSCLALSNYQGPGSTDAETNGQVSQLQTFLNQTGYLSGISGTYDNGTLGAVINFQRAYGLAITGTLTPQTIALINQQSCASGVGGYGSAYPVTNYSSGSNCYWTGSTYDSTYVCSNSGVVAPQPVYVPTPSYVAPSYVAPVYCNWNSNEYYGNNYENNYNNNYGYGNCYGVNISSVSASYSYNTVTLTVTGYGFSPSGNTIYFGNSVVTTGYSSNGTTLSFTVPAGYSWGTYGIHITNAQGISSNTLSFTLSNSNVYGWNSNGYNNGSYYNGQSYIAPSLSPISGPTNVYVGQTNSWTISEYNSSEYNGYTSSNYNYGYYPSTLSVNWGDGSVTNSQTAASTGQVYTFTHDYVTPGTYTMRITLDTNGSSTYKTYMIYVEGNNYTSGYYYGNQHSWGW